MEINGKSFQLCNSISEEEAIGLDSRNYQANIKYDGERIMAVKTKGDVILVNRRGNICNLQFQEVVEELKTLKEDYIIDGEIISLNDDFTALQRRALTKNPSKIIALQTEIPVKYMVFDIVSKDNDTCYYTDLKDRIELLKSLFKDTTFKHIELAEYLPIKAMLKKAREQNREGIIVKNMWASYIASRNDHFQKLKFFEETDIKVTKYTQNPRGIRVEDDQGNACQVAGDKSIDVKREIEDKGYAEITIQFLERTAEGRFRFPSFRELKKQPITLNFGVIEQGEKPSETNTPKHIEVKQ